VVEDPGRKSIETDWDPWAHHTGTRTIWGNTQPDFCCDYGPRHRMRRPCSAATQTGPYLSAPVCCSRGGWHGGTAQYTISRGIRTDGSVTGPRNRIGQSLLPRPGRAFPHRIFAICRRASQVGRERAARGIWWLRHRLQCVEVICQRNAIAHRRGFPRTMPRTQKLEPGDP
jgi:hypothetical protein